MRLTSLMLCGIFILFGCGSDETSAPIEQMPNYFPDAVGSRWVYRHPDGSEWTRGVIDGTNTHGVGYKVFTYTPPISETALNNHLKPDAFRVTDSQVFFIIGEKVDRYVQNEIPILVQDEFEGLELDITVVPITHPEFVFFQSPLTPSFQWDAFNTNVNGSIVLQNLVLLQFPFEVNVSVKGEVVAVGSLETPAGRFEEAYQIEYQTEIARTLLAAEAETTQLYQTVWFVPYVGIVKIEDEHGVTELIAYTFPQTIAE